MKFYVYIHTHWDREWYFTSGVSQVLLKNHLNFYIQNPTLKNFYLDGQVSLVDSYLQNTSSKNKEKFINLLKSNKIITGPWYTQPDLFNALGETTIRNLELANHVAKQQEITLSPIMYAPDTFGFPINFPQLINKFKYKKMIFWRGLNHYQKNDHFAWKGLNNYKVDCYNLKYGYFFLGRLIQWSKLTENNLEALAKNFVEEFSNSPEYKHFKEQKKETILIGSGHDQAPPYFLIEKFFNIVNKYTQDTFEIKTHEEYFEDTKNEKLDTYKDALDYATNSKIHRTIASSRYSIKKIFRDVEILLYHQLEPLQLAIKSANKNYDTTQNIIWQKELIKLQAHDALGGCVSDEVYLETWIKLNDLKNQITAEKDYILKLIANQKNLQEDEFLFFNPNVYKSNDSIINTKISLRKKCNLYKETSDYLFYLIYKKENELIKNAFVHEAIFINKNLNSFSLKKISLNEMLPIEKIEKEEELNWNEFKLIIEDDQGDTYDFDPNIQKPEKIISKSNATSFKLKDIKIYKILFKNSDNNQTFNLKIIEYKNKQILKLNTKNSLENSRVSLLINQEVNPNEIKYQQLLSLIKVTKDEQENWKTFYKEKPVNNYRTSGIISSEKLLINTYGTNEFFIAKNKISIVLYRTVDKLGKGDLNNRPGPVSGLDSKIIFTPEAQYKNKELNFDFQISRNSKQNVNNEVNNFLKLPLVYLHKSVDVEAYKMGQFVFDSNNCFDVDFKSLKTVKDLFVSSSWINFENKIQQTLVDLNTNEMKIIKNEK